MKIIALINQKGGVGKTTSTINIGAGLFQLGKRVLLVDLDPQANLTYSLGIQSHELEHSIYNVFRGEIAAFKPMVTRQRENNSSLRILPASLSLSGIDIELSGVPGREFILKEALLSEGDLFDYVLLDCPPSLGLLTVNALTAATDVFIPLQTEFLALQGTQQLLDTIGLVKKRINKDLRLSGVIATLYDQRKNLHREVIEQIQEYFKGKLFSTFIRDNISLAEAPSHGKTIFEYKDTSNGAEDYLSLCREILEREGSL